MKLLDPIEKGFTLVELAVVILIIGLLTSGTLVGMNLLRSSEVQVLIAESNDYKSALREFSQLYGGLPGDLRNASQFWSGANNGNGNQRIEGNTEVVNAAAHLGLSTLLLRSYTGVWNNAIGYQIGDGGNTIESNSGALIRIVCCSETDYSRDLDLKNYINMFSFNATNTERSGAVSPVEASMIDSKVDDGFPDGGFVGAQGIFSGGIYSPSGCYSDTGAEDDGAYLVADDTAKDNEGACQMMFGYDW